MLNKPPEKPQKSLISSFICAWHGLVYAWQTQNNFRLEVYATFIALILAYLLKINLFYIFIGCSIILSLELINTAIEALVDLVSPDWHDLAKIAKDIAAAAVLVAITLISLGFIYLILQKIL